MEAEGSPKTEAAKKKLQLDYDAATNAREKKAKAKKNSKKPRKKSTPPGVKMAGLKANMKKEALKTQGSEVLQKNKLGMDRVRSTRKTAIEAERKLREVSAKVKEKEVINADAKETKREKEEQALNI